MKNATKVKGRATIPSGKNFINLIPGNPCYILVIREAFFGQQFYRDEKEASMATDLKVVLEDRPGTLADLGEASAGRA